MSDTIRLADYPYRENPRKPPRVEMIKQPDGNLIIKATGHSLHYPASICEKLYEHGKARPDRIFLAERNTAGGWSKLAFGQMLENARSVAQWFLNRGFDQSTPLMILSSNSINQAILTFGAMLAAVPVVPISPPYSLASTNFNKLLTCAGAVAPAALFVEQLLPFTKALAALDWPDIPLIVGTGGEKESRVVAFSTLLNTMATDQVEARHNSVLPEMTAKILFTSGSTGVPKPVVNTHRNLASVPAMRGATLLKNPVNDPETLLDWLPWHHTFGGNAVLNTALYQASTLYLDDGKPLPSEFTKTIRNIINVHPTQFTSVPAAFTALVLSLETRPDLAEALFSRVRLFAYGGAALGQDIYERIQQIAIKTCGKRIHFGTGCGSTETGSLSTLVHWTMETMGQIGLPAPGSSVKLVPLGERYEMWVKGPQVTPGYLENTDLTQKMFDSEGFYNTGDAVTWAQPGVVGDGLVFSGRTSENFKLANGTWVLASNLRLALVDALSPFVQDAVITGQNRERLGALVWPTPTQCLAASGLPEGTPLSEVLVSDALRKVLSASLAAYNARAGGAATRVMRIRFLLTPPSIDHNEITDKRYINQGATLANRKQDVLALYTGTPDLLTICPAPPS